MNKRRTFTADEKAAIVRRHLWDKVPVSDLAQEHQVQPSQIHNWVNQAKQSLDKLLREPAAGSAPATEAEPAEPDQPSTGSDAGKSDSGAQTPGPSSAPADAKATAPPTGGAPPTR